MRTPLELSHLKYFYFAALEGGVAPAADRLCVQQPVVSKMIRSLEDQLGRSLFKKAGRKNQLTDYGQLIFRHCQNIFNEIEKVEDLHPARTTTGATFNVGAVDPVAELELPGFIETVRKKFPRTHVNVHVGSASDLLRKTSEGHLDVALTYHSPPLPTNLEIVGRRPTRFHVVIATSHQKDPRTMGSFIGSREIDNVENHKFPTVERLKTLYPDVRIAASSNHLGLHLQLVKCGFGVAVLPARMVVEGLKGGILTDLFPKEKTLFNLKIIARKGNRSETLRELHTFLSGM